MKTVRGEFHFHQQTRANHYVHQDPDPDPAYQPEQILKKSFRTTICDPHYRLKLAVYKRKSCLFAIKHQQQWRATCQILKMEKN